MTCESQAEKIKLENLVTSLRTDLEMSLRKQNALEKELSANTGKVQGKDATTNTQQCSSDILARELTAEKERSRRGVSCHAYMTSLAGLTL